MAIIPPLKLPHRLANKFGAFCAWINPACQACFSRLPFRGLLLRIRHFPSRFPALCREARETHSDSCRQEGDDQSRPEEETPMGHQSQQIGGDNQERHGHRSKPGYKDCRFFVCEFSFTIEVIRSYDTYGKAANKGSYSNDCRPTWRLPQRSHNGSDQDAKEVENSVVCDKVRSRQPIGTVRAPGMITFGNSISKTAVLTASEHKENAPATATQDTDKF